MKISLRQVSLLVLVSLVFTGGLHANRKWKLAKNKAGVRVYLRPQQNSPLKEFRGVMVMKTSLSTLMTLISDTRASVKFMHNMKTMRLLKQINPHERITYSVLKTPWPVSDRDSVVQSKTTQNKKTKAVTIRLWAKPTYIGKKSGMVRVPKVRGFWKFVPLKNGRIRVIYQVASSPGGKLPTWLVNSLVVDLPYNTLIKLRRIAKKPRYANAKYKHIEEANP